MSIEKRFAGKFEPCPTTGCWIWNHVVDRKGYGIMHGRERSAHRVAWELYRGPIPDGFWVLHHCDVAACVNPDHLYIGTHADNMADMARRGRARGGGPRKLTPRKVEEIRSASGTTSELGKKYGVSRRLIGMIRSGERWGPA